MTVRRGVVAAGVVIALGLSGVVFTHSPKAVSADEIVAKCKEDPQGSATCYEKEIPKLYPAQSIAHIIKLVHEVRAKDPSYQFCHVLAHKLGEAVVAEDPAEWLKAFPLNPTDGLCSNGFIHGIIVGRFRDDVLDEESLEKTIPDFQRACEPREDWQPSSLDQAICYHGLGHLFMFITNADISKSLAVCDRVSVSATGNFERVCREGVFMQIYQPLEPDDFALLELLPEKPTLGNYRRLCSKYDDLDEGACLREAWPLYGRDVMTGVKVQEFCSGQPNEAETRACYESASAIIGRMSLGMTNNKGESCSYFPERYKHICFVTTAQAAIEEDRTAVKDAIRLCNNAGSASSQCLKEIAGRASFFFPRGSPQYAQFCGQFPAEIQTVCL